MNKEILREQINSLLAQGDIAQIESLIVMNQEIVRKDNDLLTIYHLLEACKKEQAAGWPTLFEKAGNIAALMERYTKLKFFVRRIDFDVMDDGGKELHHFLLQYHVSMYEFLHVLGQSTVHQNKVLQYINEIC